MRILSSRFKDPCDNIESVWVVRENIPGFILYMCMCVWCACVFAYVWGVQTYMCVEARGWWKVYIFSIALYIICWGSISHLNSELASWTSQASQAILQFSSNLKKPKFCGCEKTGDTCLLESGFLCLMWQSQVHATGYTISFFQWDKTLLFIYTAFSFIYWWHSYLFHILVICQ